jgi:hypothetical protein
VPTQCLHTLDILLGIEHPPLSPPLEGGHARSKAKEKGNDLRNDWGDLSERVPGQVS